MLLVVCMLFTLVPTVMVSAAEEAPTVGLKDAFSKHFKIGTALSASEARKAQAQELTLTHFNSVTCENEMKPDTMLDQAACQRAGDNVSTKVRLTDNTRTILKFCEDNGIPMRGHVFVWHSQTPAWFFRENFDNNGDYVDVETMDQRLENYFISLFDLIETEFPDLEFYAWDIVNEAFTDNNPATMRPVNESNWVRVYGDDSFIYKAFRFARKHAPEGCKLYYNDYNEYNAGKLESIYELCKNLYEEGIMDGVGMQSHLSVGNPSIDTFRKAVDKYASIGCEISITELDVQANDEDVQADYYEQLFEVLLDYDDAIDAVVFWGTMDDVSWRSYGKPLLFNGQYQPKKAYYSVMDTVSDHEHDYQATVVEPTCTEEGYTTNVCSICQRTIIKDTTKALGHKWDEGRVTLEPTYTTTGIRTYECERCDATKTARIRRLGSTVPDNIDFTSAAAADAFEIENQASAVIREGEGLYLVSTTDAFEPCNGQVSTFAPKDVVKVSAEGDWIATLKVNFDQGGSQGWYEFFGFYASDDYDNMVGIRGGDGAIQDFIRKDGNVTADTNLKTSTGLKSASTHWFRIEKAGDSYICYWSTDGETFNEIFSYEETNITGDTIIIDAYSGMATGYNYILESLEFMDAEGSTPECEHAYEAIVTEPTCLDGGYTTYTCSKCADSYVADEVAALGHDYVNGICSICGEKDPDYVAPEKPIEPVSGAYSITAPHAVKTSGVSADAGETVQITADETIANVKVFAGEEEIEVSRASATAYTFEMPEADVTLKVYYAKDAIAALQSVRQKGNPFLPLWDYNPDGEPHVFEDPDNPGKYRLYFVNSHDLNKNNYCYINQVLYSCPVEDLTDWTYHGVIIGPENTGFNDTLYAPDIACVEDETSPTGKYYYYYPCNQTGQRNTMVLRSSRPDGKGDPYQVVNWNNDNKNSTTGILTFDPAVFVDDDGRVYGYWGGYNSTAHAAELDPTTMCTVKPGTQIIEDMLGDGLQGSEFGFFEASSMRKIDGVYVYVYSRNGQKAGEPYRPNYNQLAYAYSDSPLGPWTYGGIIVDAQGEVINGNRTFAGGNTHGSLVQIGEQWYITYHRNVETYARQASVEPVDIVVNEDGSVKISMAETTSQGFLINGLNPYEKVSIGTASFMTGNGKIQPLYEQTVESLPVINLRSNSVVGLKYFDFNVEAPEGCSTALNIDLIPRGVDAVLNVWLRPESDVNVAPFSANCIKIGEYQLTADMPQEMTTIEIDTPLVDDVDGKWGVFYSFSNVSGSSNIVDLYDMQFEFSDHEHVYEDAVVEPECLVGGWTEATCSVCGKIVKKDFTAPLGHEWDEGVVTLKPTPTTTGIMTYSCVRCDATKTKRLPREGVEIPENVDFTDAASAEFFTVVNQASTSIRDGEGLYMVTTTDAFEPCNGQLSTLNPKDVVKYEVFGDWEATLHFNFNPSAQNGYYQFFGFYAAEGDDYQNMAGIRGGDGAVQNFLSLNGSITADSAELNSAPGLDTNQDYWWRIVKEGTTYTCYRSEDGENFREMFKYADTGIEAEYIILDAYTGMTTGYTYMVKSLNFEDIATGGEIECEHVYEAVKTEPTCTEGGYTTYSCSKCGNSYVADEVDALGHKYDKVVTEPTCTEGGYTTYSCSKCGNSYVADEVDALGHKYDKVVTEPTCTEGGYTTYTCSVCGDSYKDDETDALGHKYDKVVTEPTCTEGGYTTYTCSVCGDSYKDDKTDALGHKYDKVVTEADCVNGGYTTYTCSVCSHSYKADETEALGHKWDDGVVTKEPTLEAEGEKTFTCSVCKETKTESIPKLTPVVHDCPAKNFTDIPVFEDWAHEGIDYAVANRLMNGISDTMFDPEGTLTRAQLVTILYRAENEPKVEAENIFSDVAEGMWYTDAIKWAAANKIVEGYGDGTFAPNGAITREQIATILYRYSKSPAVEGNLSAFPDAGSVRDYAKDAMIWATSKGIITGTEIDEVVYLDPEANATREQIAAIVMRYQKMDK